METAPDPGSLNHLDKIEREQKLLTGARYRDLAILVTIVIYAGMRLLGYLDYQPFLAFIAIGYILTNRVFIAAVRRGRLLGPVTAASITLDVLTVTTVVHFTGGPRSVFVFAYFLAIVGVAAYVNLRSAAAALALAAAAFASLTLLENAGHLSLIPLHLLKESSGETGSLYAMVYIAALLLYLIPILVSSGLLSSKLSIKERQLLRANRNLAWLHDLSQNFAATLELPRILETAVAGVKSHFGFEGTSLLLATRDEEIEELIDTPADREKPDIDGYRERLLRVAAARQPRLEPGRLTMPLIAKDRCIGAMLVEFGSGRKPPDKEEFNTLALLSSRLALFIEIAQLYRETEKLARLDGLTGIYNYRYLHERFTEEIKRADRFNQEISILLTDIDNFKGINDTYGHKEGDRLLQELGLLFRETLRVVDVPARYGGDEFAVILPDTGAPATHEVAERLRRAVASHVFYLDEVPVRLTLSIGTATRKSNDSSFTEEALIERADSALYRAKAAGGDRVESGSI